MTSKIDHLQNANFPQDPEGRVYHLGVKRGDGVFFEFFLFPFSLLLLSICSQFIVILHAI